MSASGTAPMTRLDEGFLRDVARQTGGVYIDASDGDSARLFDRLNAAAPVALLLEPARARLRLYLASSALVLLGLATLFMQRT